MASINTGVPILQTPANLEITYAMYDLGKKLLSTKPTDLTAAIKSAMEIAKRFDSFSKYNNNYSTCFYGKY